MSENPTFDYLPECDPGTPQGTMARLNLSQLRPTQNAVGMDEINDKVKRFEKKSGEKLEGYLLERPIPVIIGRKDKYYLIDHHHLAVSVLRSHGDIAVPVEVVRNWAPIKGFHFWKAMAKHHWLYPFATDGGGPVPVDSMAEHLDELGNDIYPQRGLGRPHPLRVRQVDRQRDLRRIQVGELLPVPSDTHALLDCKKDCAVTLADIEEAVSGAP